MTRDWNRSHSQFCGETARSQSRRHVLCVKKKDCKKWVKRNQTRRGPDEEKNKDLSRPTRNPRNDHKMPASRQKSAAQSDKSRQRSQHTKTEKSEPQKAAVFSLPSLSWCVAHQCPQRCCGVSIVVGCPSCCSAAARSALQQHHEIGAAECDCTSMAG
jgi:hypothetical protein